MAAPVSPENDVGLGLALVAHDLTEPVARAVQPSRPRQAVMPTPGSIFRAPPWGRVARGLQTVGLTLILAACAEPLRPSVGAHAQEATFAGEGVARRNCAECHALNAAETSPLADAPSFPALRLRYSREGMAAIIEKRMTEIHPRMPLLKLDVDEVNEFLDFWDGLSRNGPQGAAK